MIARPKGYYTSDICSVDGCERHREKNGMCAMHDRRMQRHGHIKPTKRAAGSGTLQRSRHVAISVNGQRKYEHVLVAEDALGKALPPSAQVHHFNLDPSDNTPNNLVICPDDAYHKLLHKRQRALAACGNPDFRSCRFCHEFDDPTTMMPRRRGSDRDFVHTECARAYERSRPPRRKKEAIA